MKPVALPSVVAAICGKTLEEQARQTGLSTRHFARLIRQGWGGWRVSTAEKWCGVCGFDFWDLQIAGRVTKVNWTVLTGVLRRALRGMLRTATGKDPTLSEIRELARILTPHG